MSTCQPFLLVEPFDWSRFLELSAQQRVAPGKTAATRCRVTADGPPQHAWTDVYVGELPFIIRAPKRKTALFETLRKEDRPYCHREERFPRHRRRDHHDRDHERDQDLPRGQRACTLFFYQRRVFLPNSPGLHKVVPVYGLRVADAFALQHNWNRKSYREYYDGNSVRARLLHNLDDACTRNRPRHALFAGGAHVGGFVAHCGAAGPTSWVTGLACAAEKKVGQLSFCEFASAVVLLARCPVVVGSSACSTVAATSASVLKAIAVGTGYDCDLGHTGKLQEILVDFEVYLGSGNNICVGDLCRQLAQHNLEGLLPENVKHIRPLLEQAAKKPVGAARDAAAAFYANAPRVETLTATYFASLPLHLVREVCMRNFDVTRDVPHLHALLEQAVYGWRADKRYRFKSRKFEKQTEKPTGKALLVKTHLARGWDSRGNPGEGQTVNHKWRKRGRRGKRNGTRQRSFFWQKYLLDPDGAWCLRGPRAGIRHTATDLVQIGASPGWKPRGGEYGTHHRSGECERDSVSGEHGRAGGLGKYERDRHLGKYERDRHLGKYERDRDLEEYEREVERGLEEDDRAEREAEREAEEARCEDYVREFDIERNEFDREMERDEHYREMEVVRNAQRTGIGRGESDDGRPYFGGVAADQRTSAAESGTASAAESGTASAAESGTASAAESGTASAAESGTASAAESGTASAAESSTASAAESGDAAGDADGTAYPLVGLIGAEMWADFVQAPTVWAHAAAVEPACPASGDAADTAGRVNGSTASGAALGFADRALASVITGFAQWLLMRNG